MSFPRILGILVLALAALFFGGCSVMFAGYALTATGDPVGLLANLAGFGIAGLCIWGIARLLRRPPPGGDAP